MASVVCCAILLAGCQSDPPDPPAPVTDPVTLMQTALDAGDMATADRHARQAMIAHPNDADLIATAATVAASLGRKREASILLIDAAEAANFLPASRVTFAVQALIEVGEIYAAIDLLDRSLKAHPDNREQRRVLVGFLGEVQRIDRIPPHMRRLIQDRNFDLPLLVALTENSSRRLSNQTSKRLLERNPDDRRVRLAEAFVSLYRRDSEAATEILQDVLRRHPGFAPAYAMLGQSLAESARWDELVTWQRDSPTAASDYADYWLTLGDIASQNGQHPQAARAYWEATRRDPNSNPAWDRLRSALIQIRAGDSEFRDRVSQPSLESIAERANQLLTFREHFNDFTGGGQTSQKSATQVARSLANLGRYWEAEAWSAAAMLLKEEPSDELPELRESIVSQLRRDRSWISLDRPAMKTDLSFLPEPQLHGRSTLSSQVTLAPKRVSHDHLRLVERSLQWGLKSIGEGNNPTDAKLAALIRSTGVGGGAIDFDLDGRPDLLMMNAGGTMLKEDSKPNDLLRNVGSTFIDVSESARVTDTGFGQGVAVGDYNEDGFPDLFFANLGKNRLLRNNGDGTFTDCTDRLRGEIPTTWSTSGSFVDMNRDGITDLLVSNYCKTVNNLDVACPNEDGVLGPCHPLKFPGETDQFHRGTATGDLLDANGDWVELAPPGRGLGIVSGTIDGKNLGIFVANDMSRNAFYSPQESSTFRLIDSASARGLAVDGRSLAQASMGIASSDFDLDGDLDFYVTGFAREYNIYYEQIAPGLWKDETSRLNLVQPTLGLIGFGTEAIDLDSDGIDELIVTNGHIGEFTDPDSPPYEQPLQVFRRGSDGAFSTIDDDAWGDYFRSPHVGRALWTTDVNLDGRNDVFISHTFEQVRLLINESEDQGNRIGFRLIATRSSRDGVGAVVRFRQDGQQRVIWMLSGDGYFCSNEKTLIAGLAQSDKVSDVTVTWQDGSVDSFESLAANAQYLIVQGQEEAFPLIQYP